MEQVNRVKSISIWIFIIPFIAVNACLLITTQFHSLIEHQYRIYSAFPYFDGGVSIILDQLSYPYLLGSKIDFKEDLMGAKFTVENPNASSTCGCGASFSI